MVQNLADRIWSKILFQKIFENLFNYNVTLFYNVTITYLVTATLYQKNFRIGFPTLKNELGLSSDFRSLRYCRKVTFSDL